MFLHWNIGRHVGNEIFLYLVLLVCLVFNGEIYISTIDECCYLSRNLMAHGFTTDEHGKKMSKSVGNVVDPDDVVYGGKVNVVLTAPHFVGSCWLGTFFFFVNVQYLFYIIFLECFGVCFTVKLFFVALQVSSDQVNPVIQIGDLLIMFNSIDRMENAYHRGNFKKA